MDKLFNSLSSILSFNYCHKTTDKTNNLRNNFWVTWLFIRHDNWIDNQNNWKGPFLILWNHSTYYQSVRDYYTFATHNALNVY